MTPPLISVLLPVYNAAATLGRCLRSVTDQSFRDFELLAVDDGSDDAGAEMLAGLAGADSRVRVLREPHQGIVAALNNGLQNCRGKFVARMDADDAMHPRRLELQVEYMRANPDLDLIGSQVELAARDAGNDARMRHYVAWSNGLLSHASIVRELFVEAPIVHPTYFVRRDLYRALGGYQATAWAEDYDFLLRAFRYGARFGKVPRVLLVKGDSPDCLSRCDPRYRRPAVFRAKIAHFLNSELWKAPRRVVVVGSGAAGRAIAEALIDRGIIPHAFIDQVQSVESRKVMNLRVISLNLDAPEKTFAALDRSYFFLAIGAAQARTALVEALQRAGYSFGSDFTLFA